MGLIKKLTNRVFSSKPKSDNDSKKELLRRCYFEVMEQRRVLSADPVIAAVTYLEGDAGQDNTPDHFEVTFEGGAETTQMTGFTINGDQDQNGQLSDGDMFFDVNSQQPGAGGNHGFVFDAENSVGVTAADVRSVTVSDDGLSLVVEVDNFDENDVFAFTIDVDEVERFKTDKIASGVEFEGSFFEARFVDQHHTFADRSVSVDATLEGGFVQNQVEGIFYDEYNELFAEGQDQANGLIELARDNETGQADRTAAAVDAYDLVPKPVTISGTVYHDENVNCEHDEDESGIAGVNITLQRLNEQTGEYENVATTQTDADGNYEFGEEFGLPPGTYQLLEEQPNGFLDVGAEAGSEGGIIEETVAGSKNVITNINLELGGTAATDYDFKEVLPASLSGNVWHDENNDGVFDANEQGIANVLIQVNRVGAKPGTGEDLFADTEPMFVRTDANGHYSVDQLPPGIYEIIEINSYPDQVDPLAGYIDGKDSLGRVSTTTVGQASNDRFTEVELCAGDEGVRYDFGELRPVQIGGNVSVATPEGECLDPSDPNHVGIEGVTIELYDNDGNLVASTLTDATGNYGFTDLAPGTYTIVEIQPDGYLDAGQSVGNVNGETTGVVGVNDQFTNITLTSGQEGVRYDFCEQIPAELCGTVYHDANNNGVQDNGEEGIAGVTIQLFDADGNVIAEQVTDGDGAYCFKDLYPGEYCVKEIQPVDYLDGIDAAGSIGGEVVGVAENDKINNITLKGGDQGTRYDFGEILPGRISGQVHVDRNGNCTLDAVEGERPLAGVTIELLDANGNVIDTAITDNNGEYEFLGLVPGEYSIRQIQPDGFFNGGESIGDGGGSATVNFFSGIQVGSGEQLVDYDFCEVEPASISGQVHIDRNGNCTLDPIEGERPIAGVTIELLDANGNVVATTLTDDLGQYKFEGLEAGEYSIRQIQPDGLFNGGETIGDGGGLATENLFEGIVVGAGEQLVEYDFCEVEPAEIHGRVWEDGPAIATEDGNPIEGYRNLRDGVYQAGVDTPLEGVRMQLYYFIDPVNGSTIPRAVTLGEVQAEHYSHMGTDDPDAPVWVETMDNGEYWFMGLQAGNYIVLQEQPEGFFDSNDTAGTTTGFSYNSLAASSTAPQSVISTFSAEQIMDSVVNIRVNAGEVSELNNFSEVSFVADPEPPVLPPPQPPQPPQNPPNPNPPGLGLTGLPGLAGAQPGNFTQIIGNSRGASFESQPTSDPYTWHLSVINGGQPRGFGEGDANESVWQTAGYISNEDWNRYDMDDAVWSFTETNTDSGDIFTTDKSVRFGMVGGTALAGDFDGDGIDEVAVFKDGYWMIDINKNGIWDDSDLLARLGDEFDRPVVGDWDGDGKDDIGIYGPMWERDREAIERDPGLPNPDNDPYTKPKNVPPVNEDATNGARVMKLSSFGKQRTDVVDHVFGVGDEELVPVTGDWNGNGIRSIGTFENGMWQLDVNGDGRFGIEDETVRFGQTGDVPVVGDFNGDGIEEIAVYRSGTWIIDSNGNRELDATDKTFQLGGATDQPVAGDWDGDGTDEPGIYHEDPTTRFD